MKKISKKLIVWVLLVAIMLVPNLRGYSSVGSYSEKSMAIGANKINGQTGLGNNPAFAWQAVAVAICAAYFAGWVVGTIAHHAVDNFLVVNDPELSKLASKGYNANDFSKFDN